MRTEKEVVMGEVDFIAAIKQNLSKKAITYLTKGGFEQIDVRRLTEGFTVFFMSQKDITNELTAAESLSIRKNAEGTAEYAKAQSKGAKHKYLSFRKRDNKVYTANRYMDVTTYMGEYIVSREFMKITLKEDTRSYLSNAVKIAQIINEILV